MSLNATSTWLPNISRDSYSTSSLGSLFQCLITVSEKKFFLISNLNLFWCNLGPFPLVLLLLSERGGLSPPHNNLLSSLLPFREISFVLSVVHGFV